MKIFEERYKCFCGCEYEWRATFLKNEAVFGINKPINENVKHSEPFENGYRIVIKCPSCGKTQVIEKVCK